jgi:RimJ/RimL family protein N-acetyltransferase
VTFDFKPVLAGDLLEMRPLAKEDFEGLYSAASDPLTWEQHPEKDRYKRAVFEKYFMDAVASDTALVAVDVKTGKIIGTSRYHGYDGEHSEIEIGWSFLAVPYWGGVYNGEMKKLMLGHAFKYVRNVILVIGVDNQRSRKAAEKIGGVLTDRIFIRGGRENVVYGVTKDSLLLD